MDMDVGFVRVYRPSTKSYVMYKLPHYMQPEAAKDYLKWQMPGWIVLYQFSHDPSDTIN